MLWTAFYKMTLRELTYCGEIWGFDTNGCTEKVQNDFAKSTLDVRHLGVNLEDAV